MNGPQDGRPGYPLAEHAGADISSRTGLPLAEITLEAIRAGKIAPGDLTIDRATLGLQSEIAAQAGYSQLAENLRRAAELVEISTDRVLQIYEALRPRRSTYEELLALSDELEGVYNAVATARLIRQAAEAYRTSDLLRRTVAQEDAPSGSGGPG